MFLPGSPISADGSTFDEAIAEMVDALREYAADWRERLHKAPDHRRRRDLVQLIDLKSDDQLRDWLIG